MLEKKKLELDAKFGTLEQEFEELLDKTIAEEEVAAQKNADMEETISTLKVKVTFMCLSFLMYSC